MMFVDSFGSEHRQRDKRCKMGFGLLLSFEKFLVLEEFLRVKRETVVGRMI